MTDAPNSGAPGVIPDEKLALDFDAHDLVHVARDALA
jgi:hypothetical protein